MFIISSGEMPQSETKVQRAASTVGCVNVALVLRFDRDHSSLTNARGGSSLLSAFSTVSTGKVDGGDAVVVLVGIARSLETRDAEFIVRVSKSLLVKKTVEEEFACTYIYIRKKCCRR